VVGSYGALPHPLPEWERSENRITMEEFLAIQDRDLQDFIFEKWMVEKELVFQYQVENEEKTAFYRKRITLACNKRGRVL
jgi:hypothetical protein